MKKFVLCTLLFVGLVAFSGCMAGPWTARGTVDDWAAKEYAADSRVGTLLYVFAWPIGTFGATLIDAIILNNVAWWGEDIWDGKGTTYQHNDPAPK